MSANQPPRENVLRNLMAQARLSDQELAQRILQSIDSDYWAKLCPELSLEGGTAGAVVEAVTLDVDAEKSYVESFVQDGYFRTEPLFTSSAITRMRTGIENLRKAGWPPVFSFVYDQFWQISRTPSMLNMLSKMLGPNYRQSSDIWCYYIPPISGAKGWPPHTDGIEMPHRLTIWIPMLDATIDNACMYVIPRSNTPKSLGEFHHLKSVSLADLRTLLQGSRALPARAGSVLGWDFGLIHWGSSSTRLAQPRISIAMEFIGDKAIPKNIECPLLDALGELPSFSQRLHAIGKSLLEYTRFEPMMFRFKELAEGLIPKPEISP